MKRLRLETLQAEVTAATRPCRRSERGDLDGERGAMRQREQQPRWPT